MRRLCILILSLFLSKNSTAQLKTDALLQKLFNENSNELFQNVLKQKDSFHLQIIYTQINRDKNNVPSFTNYNYNVNPDAYFYPASTVKLPLAVLTLEKLKTLRRKGIDKNTPVRFDTAHPWQIPVNLDTTAQNGLPSLAHYIKKVLLVSDNDASNRMYQFIGQKEIHKRLWHKGYTGVQLPRQFSGISLDQNRYTNQISFTDDAGKIIYAQPGAYNTDSFNFSKSASVGTGYLNSADSLIKIPMDFTTSNKIPLADLQFMLQTILFPRSVSKGKRFKITSNDQKFLFKYLSQYPSETDFPKYDNAEYYDSYVKYFFNDSSRKIPAQVRVFNKVGMAYGFLTDVAYVADFKNKVEFMLTATIYTNEDGILNDDKYEYESIGLPFLYELGQTLYRHELQRERKYIPDLKEFIMKYE